ncbi:MAG: TadE/TadG family type IV pilus assembly protein [Silvibacterium sp.]
MNISGAGLRLKAEFARCRNAARAERGSALGEATVSLVIVLVLIFGVMELCLLLYTYHIVTDAAREGTRYAIVRGSTWGTNCSTYGSSACTATSADITSYVQNLAGVPTSVTVTPECANAIGGTFTTTLSNCNAQGNVVQVNVTYNFPFSVPFVPSTVFSATSTSEMVISQ